MKWPAAVMVMSFALLLASGSARAQSFSGPLLQCASAANPAALTNCASVQDPIRRGIATINDMGDVTIAVAGAATNASYTASFVSGDGTKSTSEL
jgi:hypothetical protein